MADTTLAAIKKKVRRLTASPSPNQLSESDLEEYIDTFYEQDLPANLKLWNLHDTYTFYTEPNEDQYDFDTTTYQAIRPPVYIDGYQSFYSQSREEFFRIYPFPSFEQTGPAGTGAAGPYTFTLTNTPVLKRNVTLSVTDSTGDVLSVRDVPDSPPSATGTWVDTATGAAVVGTINYVTGAVSITWSNTVSADQNIIARSVPYEGSRPAALLFFKNKITVRPVPDKVYPVKVEVYRSPSQLLSSDAVSPDVAQWWQYIAFGAAIKILEDRQDTESIMNIMPGFQKQEDLVIYRTATQQTPERTGTIYTDQLKYPIGNGNLGGGL